MRNPQLPVLIVFSHLRWGFVFQRPQHLLSRLAGRWQVLFVEEPMACAGQAHLQAHKLSPHLTVLVPHTPVAHAGFHDDQIALLQPLVAQYLRAHRLTPEVAWLYTPMALPLAKAVAARCLVYDCMDELSAFKAAPRQLRQRESALLREADLVLAGGPSLYEARRDQHPNAHCFPSAVDAKHFAPGNLQPGCEHDLAVQALQGELPHPRVGYFGVIDERLNLPLVAAVADAHPEWSVVMVGPVVKIGHDILPQRPNIHWLGMQTYERLPYLQAGWDVCMMPFALNESTRFISPTKTLEYMAGDKPVVSTPVRDVVSLYGDVVEVAKDRPQFVMACENLLAEGSRARRSRSTAMLNTVSMYSWSTTADSVHALMLEALVGKSSPALRPAAPVLAVPEGEVLPEGQAALYTVHPSTPAEVAAALRSAGS